MALPTGTISMSQVAAELKISQTGINLNDSRVRALAGKPSGTISMNDLRGKSNLITIVLRLPANYFRGGITSVTGNTWDSPDDPLITIEDFSIFGDIGNVSIVSLSLFPNKPFDKTSARVNISFSYGSTTYTYPGNLNTSSGKIEYIYTSTNDLVLVQWVYNNRANPITVTIDELP